MWYLYTIEYYSAIKKNEIMPFAATQMQLEIFIISQKEKDKFHMVSLIYGIWNMAQMGPWLFICIMGFYKLFLQWLYCVLHFKQGVLYLFQTHTDQSLSTFYMSDAALYTLYILVNFPLILSIRCSLLFPCNKLRNLSREKLSPWWSKDLNLGSLTPGFTTSTTILHCPVSYMHALVRVREECCVA